MRPDLPEPWRGFLRELDGALPHAVSLHCLGGFVLSVCYGMPRATADIDVLAVVPGTDAAMLVRSAGRGSVLHAKHRVCLDVVTVANYPDSYEDRVVDAFPDVFRRLRLMVLDPYDLALSKLERNAPHDREDVFYLARVVPLDLDVLGERYRLEMRPYLGAPAREDLSLQLWIDAITERRRRPG
jgi:hypothetical protein